MEITVFHNAASGEGEWSRERILSLCRELKLQPTYLDAKDPTSLPRLAEATGPVAVIGGDGTVSKALARLDRKNTKLLIVPIGGANNIARSGSMRSQRRSSAAPGARKALDFTSAS